MQPHGIAMQKSLRQATFNVLCYFLETCTVWENIIINNPYCHCSEFIVRVGILIPFVDLFSCESVGRTSIGKTGTRTLGGTAWNAS